MEQHMTKIDLIEEITELRARLAALEAENLRMREAIEALSRNAQPQYEIGGGNVAMQMSSGWRYR